MPDARFLQIHTLHGYSAVLLNRDDSGLAKRISYGGAMRTRISSQCLKRHWRTADCAHALQAIDGATASIRSRETVTRKVIEPLEQAGHDAEAVKKIASSRRRSTATKRATRPGSPCCSANPRSPTWPTKHGRSRRSTDVTSRRRRKPPPNGARSRSRT